MTQLDVGCYAGMESLPPSYGRLFSAAGEKSFFFTRDWFENFEKTILKAPERAHIYGVEREGEALAAWVARLSRAGSGFWAPSRLEALGNYYTSLQGLVAGPATDASPAVLRLVEALLADRGKWDVLDLQPLDVDESLYRSLPALLRRHGLVVQTYFCFGNWYLDVAGRHYSDYFAGLSSSLRKNIPYYTRKLERNPRSRIEVISSGEQVQRALQDYEKVYRSSWKIPEPFPAFIPGFVRTAADQGWLRLGLVYVDDEAAAAQIWIVHGHTASIYKVAYDARFSKLSVGTILTAKMMQHVIDIDHVSMVDYLTGDDDYKKEWMSHRRERWGIVAFNPRRLRGALHAIRNIGGRVRRQLIKALKPGGEPGANPAT